MTRLEGATDLVNIVFLRDRILGTVPLPSLRSVVLQWSYEGEAPIRAWDGGPGLLAASRSGTKLIALRSLEGRAERSLFLVDPETGASELLVEDLYGGFLGVPPDEPPVVWAPDETRIAVALDACGTAVIDLATREVDRLDRFPPDSEPFGWDREGLIVRELPPLAHRGGRLFRRSDAGEPVPLELPVWEAPDGSRLASGPHPTVSRSITATANGTTCGSPARLTRGGAGHASTTPRGLLGSDRAPGCSNVQSSCSISRPGPRARSTSSTDFSAAAAWMGR